MAAENFKHRLKFQRRADLVDDFGNSSSDFADQFEEPAELILPRFGNEAVVASRLAGQQPIIIRVRLNARTAQIRADWRAVDARNPALVYALTAPPIDRDQTRRWLELPATHGAAA